MRIRSFATAGLAGLLLAATPAAAQDLGGWSGLDDPLVTDRPDFSESTSTVAPGHVQLEGGATLTRADGLDETSFGEVLVRLGVGDRWELRFGSLSYARVEGPFDDLTGLEDPTVGFKMRLTGAADPEDLAPGHPAAAFLLQTTVPEGDDELTSGEWVPEARLALAWALSPRFSLASNLLYSYAAEDAGGESHRFHQLGASLSTGFSVTERVGTFLEVYGFTEETEDGPSTRYLDGGVTWLLNRDLQLDARVGTGLHDGGPDWTAALGAAVRW